MMGKDSYAERLRLQVLNENFNQSIDHTSALKDTAFTWLSVPDVLETKGERKRC